MEIRMTDALVPPPEHAHLRWHWLKDGISDPVPFQWINSYWEMGGARIWPGMAGNWRYHSPCDPNAVTLDPDAIATRILTGSWNSRIARARKTGQKRCWLPGKSWSRL